MLMTPLRLLRSLIVKPDKSLDELLDAIRSNVVDSYKLLQTQDATGLSKVASTLAMQNFSLSWYIAHYEFESKTLEAEYKRQSAVSFMELRKSGATEKNADAEARIKWSDLHKQYLIANKSYRLAKNTHDDVSNLCDIMRSRIALLKQEMYVDGKKDV